MGRVDAGTNCKMRHALNAGARKNCLDAKACAQRCGSLKALNPNLFDGCVDACQSAPRPKNAMDYQINYVGPEVMFDMYGIRVGGYDIGDTEEFAAAQERHRMQMEAQAASGQTTRLAMVIMAIILIFGIHTILKK